MRDLITRSREFSRRAMVLGSAKLFLTTALVSRLYYLQIMHSDQYKTLADENRIRLRPVVPMRGQILDREGLVFAENKQQFRAMFDPVEARKAAKTFAKLSPLVNMPELLDPKIVRKLSRSYVPGLVVIKDHLNWEEVSAVEVNMPELPGVTVEPAQIRHYPLGKYGSHVLGYVGSPSKKDVEKNPILARADFTTGKNGSELLLEKKLHGKIGVKRIEVDVHGIAVRELSIEESSPGEDVRLTLDSRLQEFAAKRIEAEGGVKEAGASVVVMDIYKGDILAMASSPGFDPNVFSRGIQPQEWAYLTHHPDVPLINKCISSQYPPGSTFKIMVALAGLKEGVVTPETRTFCTGYLEFGGRRFHCWNEDGHGTLDMRGAIAQSCNVYFFKVAQRLGVDKFAEMAREFGLGHVHDIGLPSQRPGIIPDRAWKKKVYDKPWTPGETLNAGIGQGYVLSTPLQLCVMASRIANGGLKVVPRLVLPGGNDVQVMGPMPKGAKPTIGGGLHDVPAWEKIKIPKSYMDVVHEGMDMVVNSPRGTAHALGIPEKEWAIAGKSGTSQVRAKQRDPDAPVEKKYRNHALFVAYAPSQKPRYAAAVIVEHGESGSRVAGPIARDVLVEAQKLKILGDA
jgi:penicillin-binding protein 2